MTSIGPATAEGVASLRARWAAEMDGAVPADLAEFTEAVRRWMADGARSVWTARGGAEEIGMVCLTEYRRMPSPRAAAGGAWGYLGHLYVRTDHRDRGVGARLVGHVLEVARERGYPKVLLSPSPRSVPLYARAGFVGGSDVMVWRP